jgi:hypothetical protein
MQIQGNGVVIDITARGNISTAVTELQKNGFKVTGIYGRMISGIMPVGSLSQLELISSVQYARPAFKPIHPVKAPGNSNKGKKGNHPTPIISQGDTAQRSWIARKNMM